MQSPCPVAIAFQKIIERDLQFSSVQLLICVRLWILLWRYSAVRSGQMRMECSKEGVFRKSLSLDLFSSPLSNSSSFPFLPPPPPSSSFPFPLPHLPLFPPLISLLSFFSLHHFILLPLLLILLFFYLLSSFPLLFLPFLPPFFLPSPLTVLSTFTRKKKMSLKFRSQNLETERWLKSSRLMGVRGWGGQVFLKETYLLLNGHLAGFLCNAFPGQACLWLEESLLVLWPSHSYHPQAWGMVSRRFSSFLRDALNENWDWSPWLLLLLYFFYWPLTSVSVDHGSVVSVSPDNLLEMQNLRFHTRPNWIRIFIQNIREY